MIRTFLEEKISRKAWWNGNERGDYSANAGSAEAAEKIKKELFGLDLFSKIETIGSFVNFWLSEKALEEELQFALSDKFNFLKGQKIQVEFISANPTGPLTLGNGRGGVFGDVLGNVFKKAGAEVVKEYYVNDAGHQIEILGHSVLKDEQAEYKGEYIEELAQKIKDQDPKKVGKKAADIILGTIKKTVAEMGISFDVWFRETEELRGTGKVDEIIKWLKEKDLAYEKDGALWFKASQFGDTEDRVLIKKDGEPTYFCVDTAYHKNKFVERKFDKVLNVWGADHHGDVARVKGFVEALGFKEKFEIILMQFVRLVENGKPARMSKREGVYVLVDDVLKEIGLDVFRYFMLMRSSDTHMDFDLGLAKERSKKNPVYYVQYAHARACSILRNAGSPHQNFPFYSPPARSFGQRPENSDLAHDYERHLVLKLIQFPEIIEDITKDYQVHRLTTYIYELAKIFTNFYENNSVLNAETEDLKQSRLRLVEITRQILGQVLSLMGISAPEKM